MIPLVLFACTPDPAPIPSSTAIEPTPTEDAPIQLTEPLALSSSELGGLDFLMIPLPDGAIAVSTRDRRPLDIGSITWDRYGDTLVIAPAELGVLGSIQWNTFEVELRDTDGDGNADAASGFISGWVLNPIGFFENINSTLTGSLDSDAGTAYLAGPRRVYPVLPTDSILVELDEPVVNVAGQRLEHDGDVIGAPVAVGWRAGLVVEFVPLRGPWPFGATLRLAGPELVDTSGNALHRPTLQLAPDPGPWSLDTGFENFDGWALSHARRIEGIGEVLPETGKQMLEVEQDGAALGYLLVPDDAATLQISMAYLAQIDDPWVQNRSQVVLVDQEGVREVLWTANDRSGEQCLTACGGFQYFVDWHLLDLDLQPYRGERVMLLFEVATGVPFALRNRILVDSIHLRTSERD